MFRFVGAVKQSGHNLLFHRLIDASTPSLLFTVYVSWPMLAFPLSLSLWNISQNVELFFWWANTETLQTEQSRVSNNAETKQQKHGYISFLSLSSAVVRHWGSSLVEPCVRWLGPSGLHLFVNWILDCVWVWKLSFTLSSNVRSW